jgi:hypothetical protein
LATGSDGSSLSALTTNFAAKHSIVSLIWYN